jgi:hypothetical protein
MSDDLDNKKARAVDADAIENAPIGHNQAPAANTDRLAELITEISTCYERIDQRIKKTAAEMVEAGKLLLEAKDLVKRTYYYN